MTHEVLPQHTLPDELAHLSQQVTELCMIAIDVFKNAAATLYGPEHHAAQASIQLAERCSATAQTIHHAAVAALARWVPAGSDLRELVMLQRSAFECARMAEHSRRIAEHALALQGTAERELRIVHASAPDALAGLLHQVYVELRGCLILIARRDRVVARRLLAEDAALERQHALLRGAVERALAAQPQRTLALHHVLGILAELRQIGERVVAICEDQL
jgi:phosphate uptake regulator